MCLGIPGKILEKYEKDGLPYAKVDFSGITKEICLAYTPEAEPGEYVLVHVGFALNRIDEAEAQETMDFIRQIEEAAEDPSATTPSPASDTPST
ncbi:HypC/HybG/HupF family hydrogenase formation chaperone [Thermostilla marina]